MHWVQKYKPKWVQNQVAEPNLKPVILSNINPKDGTKKIWLLIDEFWNEKHQAKS